MVSVSSNSRAYLSATSLSATNGTSVQLTRAASALQPAKGSASASNGISTPKSNFNYSSAQVAAALTGDTKNSGGLTEADARADVALALKNTNLGAGTVRGVIGGAIEKGGAVTAKAYDYVFGDPFSEAGKGVTVHAILVGAGGEQPVAVLAEEVNQAAQFRANANAASVLQAKNAYGAALALFRN